MIKKLFSFIVLVALLVAGYYIYHIHNAVMSVKEYDPVVTEIIEREGLSSWDKDLVLAIIFQETKGGKVDVMQSSESVTGAANTTSDSTTSIENGVSHLAEVLSYSEEMGTDIWTGVQAYNFGIGYVDYVAEHGGVNTATLAESYSKTVVAPSLGNKTEETYRYLTLNALKYNGGKLYVNGGNFFYAQEVKFKMKIVKLMDW